MKLKSILFVIITVMMFTYCSSKTDEELYSSAQQKANREDYSEAIADYKDLLDNYPESSYRDEALFELAKLYQAKKGNDITDKESLEKSIEYYKILYTEHPDSTQSPNALFMVAFIQANELQDLNAAEESYRLFIEKYPDNELVPSAKAELSNLGIPPEEILKRNTKAAE